MRGRLLAYAAFAAVIIGTPLTVIAFPELVKRAVREYLQARDETITHANAEGLERVADDALLQAGREHILAIRRSGESVESITGEPEISIRSCQEPQQRPGQCFIADTTFTRSQKVFRSGTLDESKSYANNRLRVEYVLRSKPSGYKVVSARTITGPVYGSGLRDSGQSQPSTPPKITRVVVLWPDARNRSGWGPSGTLSQEGPDKYCKSASELFSKTRDFRKRDEFEPPKDYERKRTEYQTNAQRQLNELAVALGARRFFVLDIPLKSDPFDAQRNEFRVYSATSDVWLLWRLGWKVASAPSRLRVSYHETLGFSLFLPMRDFAAARSFSEALTSYRAALAFRFVMEGVCNLQMFVDGVAVYRLESNNVLFHTGDEELLSVVANVAR